MKRTGKIVKQWAHKHWVASDPSYEGITRKPLFQYHRYSELFFLNEATAFAAGHRSCNYCQRDRLVDFRRAWEAAHGTSSRSVAEIDARIHADRANRSGERVTFGSSIDTLHEGTFFEFDASAHLVHRQRLWKWSFDGYVGGEPIPSHTTAGEVRVLTPRSIVEAYRAGFVPHVHATATVGPQFA